MKTLSPAIRKVNSSLTKRVINLQHQGYIYDFFMQADQDIFCSQTNVTLPLENTIVKMIDQVFDYFTKSYRYIYTIEMETGEKGLLLMDGICASRSVN